MGKQRVKEFSCPVCQKESFTIQGLNGHLRITHKLSKDESNEIVNQARLAQTKHENPENTPENNYAGEESREMEQEQFDTNEVAILNQSLAETVIRLEQERADMTAEMSELRSELEQAQNRAETLQAALESGENEESEENQGIVPVPDVDEFIEHCESGTCSYHAQQWNNVKTKIIDDAIKSIDPVLLPDQVIESEGLRRGFIPTKIVLG
jgi:uncharacterized Zn finger protein (UPF0148 family)